MPALDRRITIKIQGEATADEFGEPETTSRDFGVWASRIDASLIDAATEGGERKHKSNGFCIKHWQRWRRHGDPLVTTRGDPWTARENELVLSVPLTRNGRAKPGSLLQLSIELGRSRQAVAVHRSKLLRAAA